MANKIIGKVGNIEYRIDQDIINDAKQYHNIDVLDEVRSAVEKEIELLQKQFPNAPTERNINGN